MKKIILLSVLMFIIMMVPILAIEIPETVRIGLNPSGLLWKVELSAEDGVYTTSAFALHEEIDEEIVEEDKINIKMYYIDDEATITVSEEGTLVCNNVDTGSNTIDFYGNTDFITCQNRQYRGYITLVLNANGILIINNVGHDKYLYGVVGREMSEGFPIEALKAQAVAARNYAVVNKKRHSSEGFDLCNGVHCQAYGGVSAEGESVCRAVDETAGKVLLYKGSVVECYYFSSDGGHTENSENVWVAELGYLKGKSDPYENAYEIPNYNWSVTFTAEQIENTLAQRGIKIGKITDVNITEYSENGYAKKMVITGTDGEKEYSKDNIRAALPNQLRSNLFSLTKGGEEALATVLTANGKKEITVSKSTVLSVDGKTVIGGGTNGEYTFVGKGYGHGVGMSQYGAKGMAEKGFTYIDILKFYYTDTEISD